MKIDETQQVGASAASHQASASHNKKPVAFSLNTGNLNAADLAFFDLLSALAEGQTSNQPQALLQLQKTAQTETQKPAKKSQATQTQQEALTPTTSPQGNAALLEASASHSGSASDTSNYQLEPSDLAWLQQVLNQPNTPFNGPVPVSFQPIGLNASTSVENSSSLAESITGMPVSKGLSALIEQAAKRNRAVRLELDNQASVILKFTHGKVSADFLATDPALVGTLRQQLAELRQQLTDKQLPVGQLQSRLDHGNTYRQDHQQNQPDQTENPDN